MILWTRALFIYSLHRLAFSQEFNGTKKPADFLLGALFPIHLPPNHGNATCGALQKEDGILPLEALLYTVDQINNNSKLLPGITLGIIALDSCSSPDVALRQSFQLIKGFIASNNVHHDDEFICSDGTIPLYKQGKYDKVVGVIGGQLSSVSIRVANVMKLFEVPQISYRSTSASLSNREKYPYFLRTVPTDINQADVILQVLQALNVTYASLVYSATEYGTGGMEELEKKSQKSTVCLASPYHPLTRSDGSQKYDDVVNELISKKEAKAVILFSEFAVALKLFEAVRKRKVNFLWVGSDGWTSEIEGLYQYFDVIEGAIGIQPMAALLPGFRNHVMSLRLGRNTRNPWFQEYWESSFNCSLQKEPNCSTRSLAEPGLYAEPKWLHFVRDSLYAFAHGLHDMWSEYCNNVPGPCAEMTHEGHIHGSQLYEYITKTSFKDITNQTFQFQSSGAGTPRYSVFIYRKTMLSDSHWHPLADFSYLSKKPDYQVVPGMENFTYRSDEMAFPESHCGLPCKRGASKYPGRDICCWRCENCKENQYLNISTNLCDNCDPCYKKNRTGQGCELKQEKYLDYRNQWAITSMAFASLGIFSTIFVGIIFWVHIETPVIKAASRELSYILLSGIFLSFLMTFAILAPPSTLTCGVTRFFLGFSYTLCYSAILTKTNRISRIFNKNPSKPHKAKYTSPKSQMVIVLLLVCVEVMINLCWLMYYPPDVHIECNDNIFRMKLCGGINNHSYIVGFMYPLLLVLLCTIYAIKTRKCPGGFNEARYIAFTNYTTCIIWLIFVPLYLTTPTHEDIRIVSLALSLSLGGFVQLSCLFLPKIHIVLFKPEKNTRDAVMSQQKSSSFGGGQNSMSRVQHQSAPAMVYLNGNGSGLFSIAGSQGSSNRSAVYTKEPQQETTKASTLNRSSSKASTSKQ